MNVRGVSLLTRNKLLKGLKQSQVKEFARRLAEEEFPKDALVIEERKPADRVYLLVEGKARVQKRVSLTGSEEVEIGILEEGEKLIFRFTPYFSLISLSKRDIEDAVRPDLIIADTVPSLFAPSMI